MDHLAEQLNEYGRHGIPRLPHLLTFQADEDTEEALYRYPTWLPHESRKETDWCNYARTTASLEEDWKHIVDDWTALSEKQRQQQNAIWELVQTEVAYIRTLKVITDVRRACNFSSFVLAQHPSGFPNCGVVTQNPGRSLSIRWLQI